MVGDYRAYVFGEQPSGIARRETDPERTEKGKLEARALFDIDNVEHRRQHEARAECVHVHVHIEPAVEAERYYIQKSRADKIVYERFLFEVERVEHGRGDILEREREYKPRGFFEEYARVGVVVDKHADIVAERADRRQNYSRDDYREGERVFYLAAHAFPVVFGIRLRKRRDHDEGERADDCYRHVQKRQRHADARAENVHRLFGVKPRGHQKEWDSDRGYVVVYARRSARKRYRYGRSEQGLEMRFGLAELAFAAEVEQRTGERGHAARYRHRQRHGLVFIGEDMEENDANHDARDLLDKLDYAYRGELFFAPKHAAERRVHAREHERGQHYHYERHRLRVGKQRAYRLTEQRDDKAHGERRQHLYDKRGGAQSRAAVAPVLGCQLGHDERNARGQEREQHEKERQSDRIDAHADCAYLARQVYLKEEAERTFGYRECGKRHYRFSHRSHRFILCRLCPYNDI